MNRPPSGRPKIPLTLILEADTEGRSVLTRGDSPNRDPFFTGSGKLDLICGNCDFVLARKVERKTFMDVVLICPECQSPNDTR